MGPVVRFIGTGIGLAREAVASSMAARKAKKEGRYNGEENEQTLPSADAQNLNQSNDENNPFQDQKDGGGYYETERAEGDEGEDDEEWKYDDLVDQYGDGIRRDSTTNSESSFDLDERIGSYKLIPVPSNIQRLPCSVILPQRRPRDRTRGFVRAYAPILQNVGIDQKIWMEFLGDFHRSSKANPIFMAINLAAFGAGFVPIPAVIVVTIAVQFAAETARQVQTVHRTNKFLDRINEEFLKPRGLFAMVMTYRPYATKAIMMDTSTAIAKDLDVQEKDSETVKKLKSLKDAKGVSNAIEFPEAAPLIYPSLEDLAQYEPKEEGMISKKHAFVSAYLDRRFQAKFAYENPTSQLAAPDAAEFKFASRYSDPNHPASNGSLISLMTGGYVNPRAGVTKLRQVYRDHQRNKINEKLKEEGSDQQMPEIRVSNSIDIFKKLLRQNVLYLMVVNLPTEEELAEARRIMELEKIPSESEEWSQ